MLYIQIIIGVLKESVNCGRGENERFRRFLCTWCVHWNKLMIVQMRMNKGTSPKVQFKVKYIYKWIAKDKR